MSLLSDFLKTNRRRTFAEFAECRIVDAVCCTCTADSICSYTRAFAGYYVDPHKLNTDRWCFGWIARDSGTPTYADEPI